MNSTASPFSARLEMTKIDIKSDIGVSVHCGSCSACCTSGFYIAVSKNKVKTLDRIAEDLLKTIPRIPELFYIGFNKKGHCHLLIENHCSIYDFRPDSCRTFECRIYSATGIKLDKDEISPINLPIKEWKFSYPTRNDVLQQERLVKAVSILKDNIDPNFSEPTSENRRLFALYAIQNTDNIINLWNDKNFELVNISQSG